MHKYIIKRLLLLIPVIFGVTLIVFTIMSFTPGDPARLILGANAGQESIDKLNTELGYYDPFFVRFFNYIKDIVTKFDFGKSYASGKPVFAEISLRFPSTLKLAFLGVLFMALIGVPLGILSAVKQYTWVDNLTKTLAMLFASIPGFWLGMLLILVFSLGLGWLPSSGASRWYYFILPVATLALPNSAILLRLTRSTLLETIRQDYIRTARAKGNGEQTVIWRHALKNALLPIITVIGTNFGYALGGTILIESVFGIPGLGLLVTNSIRKKDIPEIMAATIFLAVLFCVIMLVVDIIYAYVDPRIKAKYK